MPNIAWSLLILVLFSEYAYLQGLDCFNSSEISTESSRFLSIEESLEGVEVRSLETSAEKLGNIDVLISHCNTDINIEVFHLNSFQCIDGITFWIYEKCQTTPYIIPEHLTPCVRLVPKNNKNT